MKKLITNIVLLGLPATVFLIFGSVVLYYLDVNGDTISTEEIIKKNPTIYGTAYVDYNQPFKYNKVSKLKNTDVLVIGGSRSMQFNSLMFTKSFYNGGGLILNFADLEFCSDMIINTKPKIIIIGLEQYFFNPSFSLFNTLSNYEADKKNNKIGIIGNVIKDLIARRLKLSELLKEYPAEKKLALGLRAILHGGGFGSDGKQIYPLNVSQLASPSILFKDIENRINAKNNRYEAIENVSSLAIKRLEIFLLKCDKANIRVIGYLPPWPIQIQEKLKNDGHYDKYFEALPQKIVPIFQKNSSSLFFNFTDISNIGGVDEEFYDGHHPSEKIYCRKLKYIYDHSNEEIQSAINLEYINSIINNNKRFGL